MGFVLSTVATDDLVLKHQAISIHIADYTYYIGPDPYKSVTFIMDNIRKWNCILKKSYPVV